jgi:transposase
LLEVDAGCPVGQVAQRLRVDRRSVQRWVARYRSQPNLERLRHQPGQGRPRRWDPALEARLELALSRRPTDFGYVGTGWPVPLLQQWLAGDRPGPPLSVATLRRRLRERDYVWKRFRYGLNPDPAREKKRRIRRQLRALAPRTVLLARDETDLLLLPPLRAGWARRGQPAPIPLSGQNARRTVFGSLNLRTGHALFLAQKPKRAGNFQAFLKRIRQHYRGWSVALLLDETSCHTAQGSLRLAHALGIRLLWLPKRSPRLNPVEHLWRDEGVLCANYQDACLDHQVGGFIDYLQNLSASQRLRKAGVLSKKFWLRCVRH